MNLSFDLQLFATAAAAVTFADGISGGSREYTISDVVLSKAFTSGSKVASFTYDSNEKLDFIGNLGTSVSSDAVLSFGNTGGSGNEPNGATLGGTGSYTWNLSTTKLDTLELGTKAKLNLIKLNNNKLGINFDSVGGQVLKFDGGGTMEVAVTTTATTSDNALGGTIALTGGKSDVSLLGTSVLKKTSILGSSGEVISLKTGSAEDATLKLKGSGSEAFVSIGAAQGTLSSSEVNGFDKITFSAAKATARSDVTLTAVKSSNVLIDGSSVGSSISIGSDVTGQSVVSIKGGAGNDTIALSGKGAEIIMMGATSGQDTISNWVESTGDTDKGNTISLKGGISSLILGTVAGGSAQVAQDTMSGATFNTGSTIKSSDATGYDKLGVNVITDDDTYSALLFGKGALTSQQGIKFDNYNYLIADQNQTLNLGTTNKTAVVLANSVDEKHWGDTSVYQNVVTVTSSSKGKSLIINGKENDSMTANLSGANDSVWGANNLVGDEITLTKEKSQVVFTGANDGLDSISNYVFGSSASKANAVRFLDGVNYISAGNKTLTFGADENNAVVVQFANAAADSVAYGFGTEGDKYVAGVDATANGKGTIAYGSDVNVYIGQGDNSYISVDSAAKNVKLGWDGGAGYVSIGGIDATLASDGAVVIGTTDNAQSIAGSSRGASSISGGFVADEWTDTNADTLYGGGVATKTTTFFVGDKMGKDEIQNLSSKDNIVFLGTKYEDLVKFAPETTDSGFTFKFANGNVIEATAGNKKLANIKDVSLYFDDGTYIWNGSTIEKAE